MKTLAQIKNECIKDNASEVICNALIPFFRLDQRFKWIITDIEINDNNGVSITLATESQEQVFLNLENGLVYFITKDSEGKSHISKDYDYYTQEKDLVNDIQKHTARFSLK